MFNPNRKARQARKAQQALHRRIMQYPDCMAALEADPKLAAGMRMSVYTKGADGQITVTTQPLL